MKTVKIKFTATENLKFNQILDKEQRNHCMSIYRFMLKKTIEKIIIFNDNTMIASIRELCKGYNQECFSKYRCKTTKFFELITLLEELGLLKITNGGKFKKNVYEFHRFFNDYDDKKIDEKIDKAHEEQDELVNLEKERTEEMIENASKNDSVEQDEMENPTPISLLYFTSTEEAENLAKKLLEEFKPKKTNNVYLAARSRVLEKVRKYYSKIAINSAEAYMRTIITESLTVCRKISNKIKNKINNNKISNTNLNNNTKKASGYFSNYTQREYTQEQYKEFEDIAYDNAMSDWRLEI